MPALLAFLEIWYSHFFNAQTHAVLPYSQRLKLLPEFLQQLTMESNGKSINLSGEKIDYPTGSVLWGAAGTNGQHSFHQLLHQGTHLIPVDFILPLHQTIPEEDMATEQILDQQCHLVANCLAQCEAMLYGRSLEQVENELRDKKFSEARIRKLAPHLVIPGNRPHSLVYFNSLNPETLGALIALYEHKVYIQSLILNINAFDQWGVELGKKLSQPIYEHLKDSTKTYDDPGLQQLIKQFHKEDGQDSNGA
jgi:glucose-6-phosphate isomerase